METFLQTVQMAWWNMTHRMTLVDIADILIVAVIIYQLILLMRQTVGTKLIYENYYMKG